MIKKLIKTDASKATILIRLMVGVVFLSEGVQKFIFPGQRGTARFNKMGFEEVEMIAHFVGIFEIVAGILILIGLFTRVGAFTTLIIMTMSIITKIPVAFGESFSPFVRRDLNSYGFWSMAHEMHTDFAMWFGSMFLILICF